MSLGAASGSAWGAFDGRLPHRTSPFAGERWSLIYYVNSNRPLASPEASAALEKAGFPPPAGWGGRGDPSLGDGWAAWWREAGGALASRRCGDLESESDAEVRLAALLRARRAAAADAVAEGRPPGAAGGTTVLRLSGLRGPRFPVSFVSDGCVGGLGVWHGAARRALGGATSGAQVEAWALLCRDGGTAEDDGRTGDGGGGNGDAHVEPSDAGFAVLRSANVVEAVRGALRRVGVSAEVWEVG